MATAFPNMLISRKAGLEVCLSSPLRWGAPPTGDSAMALPAPGLHSWWQLIGRQHRLSSVADLSPLGARAVPFPGCPPRTTTHPDIYWAVTREILAVQLPCSPNWGGISHLFTKKKLWLIGAWQELLAPILSPPPPSWVTLGPTAWHPPASVYPSVKGYTALP